MPLADRKAQCSTTPLNLLCGSRSSAVGSSVHSGSKKSEESQARV